MCESLRASTNSWVALFLPRCQSLRALEECKVLPFLPRHALFVVETRHALSLQRECAISDPKSKRIAIQTSVKSRLPVQACRRIATATFLRSCNSTFLPITTASLNLTGRLCHPPDLQPKMGSQHPSEVSSGNSSRVATLHGQHIPGFHPGLPLLFPFGKPKESTLLNRTAMEE